MKTKIRFAKTMMAIELFAQETVFVSTVWKSIMLKSVIEASYRGQTRRTSRRIPLHHMRKGLLLAQFTHDTHLYVSQVKTWRVGYEGYQILLGSQM
ncbi:CLUMA_CG004737, isoform A [Clunio marinus]|uniref:CLUMA_CG004737, isoform A n=1 Tax=Clunio marinus TaxID=568069 RepID=A0A1J1HY34_9DIPT|nr:CLUMA_CG004737, isoform A [Clunio marinus]